MSNGLIESLIEIIKYGQYYLFVKKSTLTKVIRLFIDICRNNEKNKDKALNAFIFNITKTYILPSIEFHNYDASVPSLIDKLITLFRYKVQIEFFQESYTNIISKNIHLTMIFQHISSRQNKYLGRISDISPP